MKHRTEMAGFTLVEVAIAMLLIGLAAGGVLKARELIANARVTEMVSTATAISSAISKFEATYINLPGDFRGAEVVLAGCTSACSPGNDAHAGDGYIGWEYFTSNWSTNPRVPQDSWTMADSVHRELPLFWAHLALSDILPMVPSTILTAPSVQVGLTQPASPFGGAMFVAYLQGDKNPPAGPSEVATTTSYPKGHYLIVTATPNLHLPYAPNRPNTPMTSRQAATIDTKIDDGKPSNGIVHGWSNTGRCFNNMADPAYTGDGSGRFCGIMMKM